MTGFVRHDARPEAQPRKREIAETVHHLMPDELVRRAERVLHHAMIVQHHSVLRRRALDQAAVAQKVHLPQEAERTRKRKLAPENVPPDPRPLPLPPTKALPDAHQ